MKLLSRVQLLATPWTGDLAKKDDLERPSQTHPGDLTDMLQK